MMNTLRTIYPIYYFFIIFTFFLKGNVETNFVPSESKADVVNPISKTEQTEATPIEKNIQPSIILKDTQGKSDFQTITSSLNGHTHMTLGLVDEQYAIVIKTVPIKSNGNPISAIVNQEFGDEIDEIENNKVDNITNNNVAIEEEFIVAKGNEIVDPTLLKNNNDIIEIEDDLLAAKGSDTTIDESLDEEIDITIEDDFGDETFNINDIDASYLLGKFNPATHDDFEKISSAYASKRGMYIRKDVYEAYKKMYVAAQKQGIDLKILSATRSFSAQKRIWEAKWSGKRKVEGKDLSKTIPFGAKRAVKILEYSAMPGTSRHHWGTDIDLVALNNEYFATGKGKKIYDWLDKNANSFGFYQPYTADKKRTTGHSEEKWHWSYLPISKQLITKYSKFLDNSKVDGFMGDATADEINIIQNYVLGIDEDCK